MSKAAKWIGSTLLVVMMLVMLLFLISPQLSGVNFFHVNSGSMSPTIPVGSLIMVHSVDPQGIEVGDVITFQTPAKPNETVVHRVIEVFTGEGSLSFRTMGDANGSPDKYTVPAENVIGKVWFHLPFLGYLVPFIGTKLGFLVLVCLPALILISLEVRNIILELKAMRKLPHGRLSPALVTNNTTSLKQEILQKQDISVGIKKTLPQVGSVEGPQIRQSASLVKSLTTQLTVSGANNPTSLWSSVAESTDETSITNVKPETMTPRLTVKDTGIDKTEKRPDIQAEAARIVAEILERVRSQKEEPVSMMCHASTGNDE